MKRILLIAGVGAALVIAVSTAAIAFEEQRQGAPVPAAPGEAAAPKAQVQDAPAAAKAEGGTEIRIPGLGKLGTLPKMDFGLELLYGAADAKPAQDEGAQSDPDQDLTIHGSVKHRF